MTITSCGRMEKASSESWVDQGSGEGYDAVVVGSGYGGSVAAFRLSMAGFKVCLLEKGRKWEAQDFPRDSWKILSSVRVEKGGVKIGPKDALFQIHQEQDCLAAVACGLGGGSLVNAGVMLPTPASTRRNPKWPKEWETDWEFCQASAAAMLRIQTIPAKFQTAKVMDQVLRECCDSSADAPPLKLSVNFDMEDHLPAGASKTPREMGTCLACGNCLAGCPFGAKNSTDKTYLVSAVQAGCTIKTESEVQFIVRNQDDIFREHMTDRTRKRRWLVFLDDYNYITSDFVILSAGVFGTTKILFRSQARGLKFSERLGSGLSCNGNNVAFLAGSSAPLNARGLSSKNFSSVPFKDRPGPSISSSYISSLGFTIQSAVVPSAYPSGLFKGITTYIWPSRNWFLYCIKDKLQHFFGLKESQEMVLNVMGCDESDGELTFKKETESICFRSPRDPLLPRKIEALHKITKKLGGCLFMSRFRSTSVHLLGGCNATPDASGGVCNLNGQVFDAKSAKTVHHGLYVCDASLIPCSVGVNPCLTIATIAERLSKDLVQDALRYQSEKEAELSDQFWATKPDKNYGHCAETSSVDIKETMTGQIAGMPCSAFLKLRVGCGIYKDCAAGSKHHRFSRGKAGGYIEFRAVEMDRMYVIHGEVDLCGTDPRTPYTQYMHYHLLLGASSGSRYVLEGKKVMNPYMLGLYAWKESTTMHVTFRKISDSASMEENQEMMALKGKLHISFMGFLKTVISVKGNSRLMFLSAFLQSLLRTYILKIPRRNQNILAASELPERQYPTSTLHKIRTEDGFIISCRQWKCYQSEWGLEEGRKLYPVLLINGYSTESFWLPTEPNDLVRTLLQEGHEVWLLQSRVHPLNSSNSFSIEDIGRFDIPSVIDTILELHGASMKIHVVAHCIGGLAFHIAVMGGHVSAKQIASISCTNSSMFFKITTSSLVKMWLPLIPISMAILGNNKTLPMFQSLKMNTRQTLLKSIARFLPRYERCSSDECEVFSGIFGNAFWHGNVTQTMHSWVNKVSLPALPMAAFPHLRKICKSGNIVDAKGNNSYLIHPERMALHTLYISGGRTLLVTPETSFLANKYMKLHQPEFRHGRVVVDGFGHSDLLIGEESDKKVFPHILEHIALAENGRSFAQGRNDDCNSGALHWGDNDPYDDEDDGFWSWNSIFVTLVFLVVFFFLGGCIQS